MLESTFWSSKIEPVLHQPDRGRVAWKIPAELRKGVPDVWYSQRGRAGWLELKYNAEWPKRNTTPLRLHAYTVEQRAHLREARQGGSPAHLLLGIAREWFLLDPPPSDVLERSALQTAHCHGTFAELMNLAIFLESL